MKLAELFAEISFKVNGADDLTKFDNQMKSIAANAREAVIALRQLARTQLPKQFIPQNGGSATPRRTPQTAANLLGLVPASQGNAGAQGMIRSANIIIQSARIVVQEGAFGGGSGGGKGPGGGGGGVIPNAGGNAGLGGLARFGLGVLGFASLLAVVRSLISNFKEMVNTSRQATVAQDKLTASTGLSAQELKKWEYLGSKANIPGVFEAALAHLNQQQARAAAFPGTVNFAPYAIAHVDFTKDPAEQLRQFFRNSAGLPQKLAEARAAALGLDPSIVYARRFLNPDGSAPELQGAALSNDQKKAVLELNQAWQEFSFNLSSLKDKLTSDVSPALTQVLEIMSRFERFLLKNDDARGLIGALGGNPAALAGIFAGLAPGLMYADATRRGPTPSSRSVSIGSVSVNNTGIKDPNGALNGSYGAVRNAVSDALYNEMPAAADR